MLLSFEPTPFTAEFIECFVGEHELELHTKAWRDDDVQHSASVAF